MSKGRLTIPTDENFVEGTKKYVERWGADAVRDCDGTELPKNAAELAEKVYKTYFVVRGDNDFAYAHDEYMQNIALISERHTAFSDTLEIDLMEKLFDQQIRVNTTEYKKYWQVFDRTTGEEISTWDYVGDNKVRIFQAKKMHEYTVNFFGYNLWDATQVYNYTCNNWTVTKDRCYDPIYPEVLEHILQNLDEWMEKNPQVNVIRFTTFLYHFFLLYLSGVSQKLFDWYNYAMSASPAMFKLFEKEYGYEMKLEYLLDKGTWANQFIIPSKPLQDYYDLVQRFVSKTMAKIIDKVHAAGKEAMMFWGDNWMGAEPYGKYFAEMKLDAVVGSVSSGTTVRAVSDIPNLKYKEIRLLPYFFPDTLNNDERSTNALLHHWAIERRAILRKPVDRIGFGGYLSLADKLPNFCATVERVANEFRTIYDTMDNKAPYCSLKVAILSYWGKEKSWMTNMVSQDAPYPITGGVLGFLESLAGLPVDIDFISFEDVKAGRLQEFDVVFNAGVAGTAFSGDYYWKDTKILELVREYIANGGGFIGIREPSAYEYGGRFFQLSDALGVDVERGKSILLHRHNTTVHADHFILRDKVNPVDYKGGLDHVFANDGAIVLDIAPPPCSWQKSVKMAANEYGKGRCFYTVGLGYNAENTRLLYRAMLWCAHKEELLEKAFASNVHTECHYYPASKTYALVNNTAEEQKTTFYDIDGKAKDYTLAPNEIIWIKE
ncbi:MAG: 1,3-beta-galactosyl-N-acetylhexosamine phosphorylase [Clostridia bacterium]|nr:1,3-beta-galactosyl-N-acetylhexosamine phosphorylase [Clostridia bacterium]